MAAACPNLECRQPIERSAETGKYPAKCPHCGIKLVAAKPTKPPAVEVKPTPPRPIEPPPPPEKVIRASSDRSTLRPGPLPTEPTSAPSDDPFGIAEVSYKLTESEDVFGVSEPTPPPALTPKTPTVPVKPSVYQKKPAGKLDAFTVGLYGGIGVIVLGIGLYLIRASQGGAAKGKPAPTGDVLQNTTRNYALRLPSSSWVNDEVAKKERKVDLAFRHADHDAWITLTSGEALETIPPLAELEDEVIKSWTPTLAAPRLKRGVGADLGKESAARLGMVGDKAGVPYRKEAFVMTSGGLTYRLTLEAPEKVFASLGGDFGQAKESFHLLGPRTFVPRKPKTTTKSSETGAEVFASRKFSYRLSAPKGRWKESSDVPNISRFADVSLADATGQAFVVVSPRETASIEGIEQAYIQRQTKLHDKGFAVQSQLPVTVGKFAGRRLQAKLAGLTEQSAVSVTYLSAPPMVYQIECIAPTTKVGQFNPWFQHLVDSFEVVAAPTLAQAEPAPTQLAQVDPAMAPKAEPTPRPTEPKPMEPAPKAIGGDFFDAGAAKPKAEPAKKATGDFFDPGATAKEKPPAEKMEVKSTTVVKKRKSLDDLE